MSFFFVSGEKTGFGGGGEGRSFVAVFAFGGE